MLSTSISIYRIQNEKILYVCQMFSVDVLRILCMKIRMSKSFFFIQKIKSLAWAVQLRATKKKSLKNTKFEYFVYGRFVYSIQNGFSVQYTLWKWKANTLEQKQSQRFRIFDLKTKKKKKFAALQIERLFFARILWNRFLLLEIRISYRKTIILWFIW